MLDAVFNVYREFQGKQDGLEIIQCPLPGPEAGGICQHLAAVLKGRDQQPQQGEHTHNRQNAQIYIGKYFCGGNTIQLFHG